MKAGSSLLLILVVAAMLWLARPSRWTSPAGAPAAQPAAPQPAARAMTAAPPPRPAGVEAARPLFRFTERPAAADQWDRQRPAPTRQRHYVRVDPALFEGKDSPFWKLPGEGRLSVPLPDGSALPVTVERSELLDLERFVSHGRITGQPGSKFVLSYSEGAVHMLIENSEGRLLSLRYGDEATSELFYTDEELVSDCGGGEPPLTIDPRQLAALALARAEEPADSAPATPPAEGYTNPATPVVDIMMLATTAVLNANGNSLAVIRGAFDVGIALTNSVLRDSAIPVQVRLVHVATVDYDEQAAAADKVQDNALDHVTELADGKMDQIHQWRDQYGADLVCLTLQRSDPTSSGIAWRFVYPSLNGTEGWDFNAEYGFSIVEYGYVSTTRVLPHELGHNFGCSHNREDATTETSTTPVGTFPYSFGYRFETADGRRWRTMMAYNTKTGPSYQQISYFSNPSLQLVRDASGVPVSTPVPLGIAEGQTGACDNAFAITQTSFEVAAFRHKADRPYSAGRMINVSTLARVGTDAEAMIGGFIIQGSSALTVAIRAGGPSLIPAGVSNVLLDPQMELHGFTPSPVLLASNDNWQTGTGNTSAALSASGLAPSNPLEPGLQLTLQPGAYTASISGRNSTTGTAIIEVYEVGGSGNRLINLSTRGYAAVDRPMIGGFIVQGNPGQTKRIVIRAGGPGLAAAGVPNALSDPVIELYNSSSKLILAHDDFSTNATGTDGASPTIDTYAESAIVAAGLAPANRREPAVMLDLEPGSYTVMLKPFERLPSQPGRAGIGIIEVYEVQ